MDNIAYVQLPTAYRSLSRPSSALDAKAFPLRSYQLDLSPPFSGILYQEMFGSHKNYAGLRFGFNCSLCYPFMNSTNFFVTSLLLARNFLLASLFSFQGAYSNLLQGQIEMLIRLDKHFNPISLVEVIGLEPVTPCLQSRCSTS